MRSIVGSRLRESVERSIGPGGGGLVVEAVRPSRMPRPKKSILRHSGCRPAAVVAGHRSAFESFRVTKGSPATRESTSERVSRVLVVINQRAGGVRREPSLAAKVRRLTGTSGEVVATADTREIDAALRRALMDGVDTVAICGGDGTAHSVLTSLARVYGERPWPRVALLAGGTVNNATRCLGFGGPVAERLEALMSSEMPRLHRTPLVAVDGRVGFTLGTQMPARVMDAYYDGRTGVAKCVWLTMRIAASALAGGPFGSKLFEPDSIDLEIDGRPSELHRATAIIASVVPALSVGIRVAYRAGEDGGFHFLATDSPPRDLALASGRLWAGLPTSVMTEDTLARRVRLEFREPSPYMLDGDVFSASRLDIVATRPVELIGAS